MAKTKLTAAKPERTDLISSFSHDSFRKICDQIPGMVALYSIDDGGYIYVNSAIKKLLGYEPKDFIDGGLQFVSSLVHPDDIADIQNKNSLAIKKANRKENKDTSNEPIVSFEYRMKHKDGRYVWLHTDGSVFTRNKGKIEQLLNISIDISEHKNTMAKLAKTHTKVETAERFALAQSVAKLGTFEWILKDNVIIWSPEMEDLYGLTRGTFSGTAAEVDKFMYPEDKSRVSKSARTAIKGGPPFNEEYRIIWPDGSIHWMLSRGKVIRDKDGEAVRFIGVNLDITDQKEAEEKLRASDERYQAFIHNSNEAIWRFELDKPIPVNLPIKQQIKLMFKYGYLAEANLAMAKMYGISSVKTLVGARLGDLLIPEDQKNIDYLTAFIKSKYKLSGVESHEVDAKGNDKYFNNSLVGVIENGLLIRSWGTQQDITEQYKAAVELRRSEERLALALEASELGIWEWDILTNELHWSPQLKRIFGLKPSVKITYDKYIQRLHPDDKQRMQDTIKSSLKTGKNYQAEHRVVWDDGSIHWVLGQGKAFLVDGKPIRMTGTSLNIDERKKTAELEAITKHLIAERKLLMQLNAAKDEFISIASHQLRTPATAVKQYLGMLLAGYAGELTLTKEQLEMINTANDSNERQIRIVADLLRVAQVDAGKVSLSKERIELIGLIKEIVNDFLKNFEAKGQTVKLIQPSRVVYVFLDKSHIRMVLENILDNASKYSPDKTVIQIKLKQTPKHIVINVIDQGVGISKSDQKKLFKKFSRIDNPLSMVAGGSGLGLYWAKKIVNLHRGRINVLSKPGVGTTFTIRLPNELNS